MAKLRAVNHDAETKEEISAIDMPVIGLGVWMMNQPNECFQAVRNAISIGYRLIDTARAYGNEKEVGEAIRDSSVPREEITVVTKLRRVHAIGYESTIEHCRLSLELLGLKNIDLYLVHAPPEDTTAREPVWRAMEDLLSEGMVRSIGVSNYGLHHLEHLKSYARVLPSVNQVELNPWIQRRELHKATKDIGALTMAYSPLARGQKAQDTHLESMCEGLGFTAPQAAIKWCMDNGAVVIPKSSHPGRQLENFQSMDVDLSGIIDEMNKLDSNYVSGWDPTVEP
tara:strand:+ start:3941 stop:4789 length:849 start_codon:yes stop_codon:yes gene_type:complete